MDLMSEHGDAKVCWPSDLLAGGRSCPMLHPGMSAIRVGRSDGVHDDRRVRSVPSHCGGPGSEALGPEPAVDINAKIQP